jgi:cytochrome c556
MEDEMEDLISIAVLVATLYGGTVTADKIYNMTREAALTKAAHGLPRLAPFAKALTTKPREVKHP